MRGSLLVDGYIRTVFARFYSKRTYGRPRKARELTLKRRRCDFGKRANSHTG